MFIPVALMGGIHGPLEPAVRDHDRGLGADLGVQRADAVAGARGDAAAARGSARGLLGALLRRVQPVASTRARDGYVSLSHGLIRKPLIGIALLVLFAVAPAAVGQRLPTQLPARGGLGLRAAEHSAAAGRLARADRRGRADKVETILKKTRRGELQHDHRLQPAHARHGQQQRVLLRPARAVGRAHDPRASGARDRQQAERQFARDPGGDGVRHHAAVDSRASAARAASSCGCRTGAAAPSSSSNDNLQTFLAAARKRPELAGVTSPFTANVPQIFADVDRDKVLRSGRGARRRVSDDAGVSRRAYVNQFNRFGRQWRSSCRPRRDRQSPEHIGAVLRAERRGTMVPLSALQSTTPTFGPQFTNRFNVYRAAQITGSAAPGYSSGQAMAALEEVARARRCRRRSATTGSDLSYQEKQAAGATRRSSRCRWSSCS